MELRFHDNYVVLVLVLLWAVCFCGRLVDTLGACARLLENCTCLHACAHARAGELVRQVVVLFCFLQPAVFCGLYALHRAGDPDTDKLSTTILHSLDLQLSSAAFSHGNRSGVPPPPPSTAQLHLLEIDYLFVVLPFSGLVSVSSLCWVQCINSHALAADSKWDDSLADSVFIYEAVYYFELWTMNLSCLAVACAGRSVLEVHFAALALTLLLVHVSANARVSSEDHPAEHAVSIVVTLLLCAVLAPVWLEMLQRDCVVAVGVLLVHSAAVATLAAFHLLARGDMPAASVLAVRVTCTIAVCCAHIVAYAVGRNGVC